MIRELLVQKDKHDDKSEVAHLEKAVFSILSLSDTCLIETHL